MYICRNIYANAKYFCLNREKKKISIKLKQFTHKRFVNRFSETTSHKYPSVRQ